MKIDDGKVSYSRAGADGSRLATWWYPKGHRLYGGNELLGSVERGPHGWRGVTSADGVVIVDARTRAKAAYALYCQRFGNPGVIA